jgi:hypothetical protein
MFGSQGEGRNFKTKLLFYPSNIKRVLLTSARGTS